MLQLVRVAIASSPRAADIEGRGLAEGAEAEAEDAEASSIMLAAIYRTDGLFHDGISPHGSNCSC